MPKQNRPLVRDGRLQVKKRTDRSYLRTEPAAAPPDEQIPAPEEAEIEAEAPRAAVAAEPQPAAAAAAAARTAPTRLPSSVRAIQQQGVRKRRDVDLDALAASDTRYALHELRRIAILTVMVIATLIVLAIVLR